MIKKFIIALFQLKCIIQDIERIKKQMAELADAVAGVVDAEGKLEARVSAHEQNLKDVAAGLQAQIDALTVAGADVPAAVTALTDLKNKVEGFDPDAAPAPAP